MKRHTNQLQSKILVSVVLLIGVILNINSVNSIDGGLYEYFSDSIKDNLTLYLPFDRNYSDFTGHGYEFIRIGDITKVSIEDGIINNASRFEGNFITAGVLNISNKTLSNPENKPFSINMWIYNNDTNNAFITGTLNSTNDGWVLYREASTNNLKYYQDRGEINIESAINTFQNQNWTMLSLVKNSTNTSIYINAVLMNITSNEYITNNSNDMFTIGSSAGVLSGNNPLLGKIDEYSYWERGINESEISYLYNLGSGGEFLIKDELYNLSTYSQKIETFKLSIYYNSFRYSSISANLVYNGTNYPSIISGNGLDTDLVNTLIMPQVNLTTSMYFYWNISLTNSTGTFYFNSTNYTQTIDSFNIYECNQTINNSYINISFFDSESYARVNTSVKLNFQIGSYVYNYINLNEVNNSFAFCFVPSDISYNVTGKIEYYANNYELNYYYFNNLGLTNVTTNLSLYLLNSSKGTATQLEVRDSSQTPEEDVYIQIQRYDTGTNTYYTIAMSKTDFNGQDIAYLNWYDTFYKYTLIKDGQVIKMTNVSKIYTSPVLFTLDNDLIFDYDKFNDVTYDLSFNNITKNFILTYSLPSGDITSMCLRVVKRTIKNDTTICQTCETSSSATIYCNINNAGNGTFIATVYATGSLGFIESLVAYVNAINTLYEDIGSKDGTAYALLFGALVLAMFMISPVFAVVGTILGLIGAMALGFQPVHYTEFFGLTIIGVIVIIILKR